MLFERFENSKFLKCVDIRFYRWNPLFMPTKLLMIEIFPKYFFNNMNFFQKQFLSHPLLKCDLYLEGAYQVSLFFQLSVL